MERALPVGHPMQGTLEGDPTARFTRTLPERVTAVCAAITMARSEPSAGRMAEARRGVHQLAGTAGSFGRHDIGRAARTIESGLLADPISWDEVERAVAELVSKGSRPAAPVSTAVAAEKPAVPLRHASAPRVLIVDPAPGAATRYLSLFARQVADITCVPSAHLLSGRAGQRPWDVIFVHASPEPGADPFADARLLRASLDGRKASLVVVSDQSGIGHRVDATHAGVDLFLPSPLSEASIADALSGSAAKASAIRPRVVVLDDDEHALELMAAILGADDIDVTSLGEAATLMDVLRDVRPHALILDFQMPQYNGAELCASVRSAREHRDIPILFVSARVDAEARRAAYEAGCDDFLLKPVSPEELCVRVRSRIERAEVLRVASELDTLTGLPLRRVFVRSLEARISAATRRGSNLALTLIDLDQFKLINDTHGHLAGDHVLAELGATLDARFRSEDLRCRWGGEEFLIAFPDTNAATVRLVMERVLSEFSSHRFTSDSGADFSVTFSAGVAELPDDGVSLEPLIRAADVRLYEAKRAGRARIVGGEHDR